MKMFLNHPSQEEADAIGDFLFSSDQSETILKSFAPKLTYSQAFHTVYTKYWPRRDKLHFTLWLKGTIVRSQPLIQRMLTSKHLGIIHKIGYRWYLSSKKA